MGRLKATDKSLSTVQPAAMNRSHSGFLAVIVAALICSATVVAAATSIVHPLSGSRRSAALELFAPQDGSFGSLEEAYDALRTDEFLGVDETPDLNRATCRSVSATLGSSSSSWKELFYALKVNKIVKCKINDEVFEGMISRLQAAVSSASSLLDFYYSVGSLVLTKDQTSKEDLYLVDAEGIFRSIKALSQGDGRWRYSSNNAKSSIFAAGLALEALAGVISLSSFEIDQLLVSWSTWQIGSTKNDILKLFESIEKYDNGALYFDETLIDAGQHQGPLSTTSSVVRGLAAFAAVTSGGLHASWDFE